MNYASWIEEKNLKKTFIMATLASTLVGTFTASMGLLDRVSEKRQAHKQRATDSKQDSEIKALRKQFDEAQKAADGRQQEIERLKNGGGGGPGMYGGGAGPGMHSGGAVGPYNGGRFGDDVGFNLQRDGMMIQRMYDDAYGRYGRRFAQGDAIAENQLQAQIIALQQTVINVLQDALYNDRQLTRADMNKLIAASNSARDGSLEALKQAQLRLGDGAGANGSSSRSSSPSRALTAPKRVSTTVEDSSQLFCRYALDLQYISNKPLAASFAPGGACICPSCDRHLDVTADDFWMIGKRTPRTIIEKGYETDVFETREFRLAQRFVLKCHTPDGEFACTICNRNRDVDAICRTVDALVKHVGTYHEVDELEREADLREVVIEREKRRGSLAAPRGKSPPEVLRREREEFEVREYRS